MVRVACVQTTSGDDVARNLDALAEGTAAARREGAELIAFPECVALMGAGRERAKAVARDAETVILPRLRDAARGSGAWLLAGTIPWPADDGRVLNRSLLLDPEGAVRAAYDKIHMFDVDIDGEAPYRESATYRPGGRAVLAETPFGPVGLTVCYDLRFPHLHRRLARAGALILTVPSAFTRPTGRAHWHVLLRARAIETGAFVLAPAQTGEHPRGRTTYGHSLIVDPWGGVLADAGVAPGVIVADLDLEKVRVARRALPSLTHDRPFDGP